MTTRIFGRIPLQRDMKIEMELRKLPKPLKDGIYGEVGRGGNCTVNLRVQRGEVVVVKIPKKDKIELIEPTSKIIEKEYEIMEKIYTRANRRIPKPIELGRENGVNQLSLELVEFPTVQTILTNGGIREEEKAALVIECANAVIEAAHDNRVVHRDIKEGNFLLGEKIRLIDFGTSKILEEDDSIGRMHKFGRIGTIEYRAPEITAQNTRTIESDIYAFGMMMYFIFNGKNHLEKMEYDKVLDWHKKVEPPKIQTPAWRVIEACLRKDPRQRPQNMRMIRDGIGEEFEKAQVKVPRFCES